MDRSAAQAGLAGGPRPPHRIVHRIVHLSDVHFGTVPPALVRRLLDAVDALAPDAVVLTGDFTQRARRAQFRAAAELLAALPQPVVIAPGNHDVPLYNLPARLLARLGGYRDHLLPHGAARADRDAACIVALDSTRRLTIQRGRLGSAELERARELFAQAGAGALKIAALHHPPVVPPGVHPKKRLIGADAALGALAAIGVDVILSGHTHRPHAEVVRGMLSVTAGSAVSGRHHDHGNSFFVLEWDSRELRLTEHRHDAGAARFDAAGTRSFERRAGSARGGG